MKKLNITQRLIRPLRNLLKWLQVGGNHPGYALCLLEPILNEMIRVQKTRGISGLFTFVKCVRGNLLNYLSGNPERISGVALRKSGLPKCLGALAWKLEQGEIPTIGLRFILTVLFSTRALKSSPEPDIQSIVGPSKRSDSTIHIGYLAKEFWRQLGYLHRGVIPRSLRFRRFHFTTKSGPTGHGLNTWYNDYLNLPLWLRKDIVILGGDKMKEFLEKASFGDSIFSLFFPIREKKTLRKLSYFSDKEGKTRVIAILDYFSQTVLKGLHQYLYRALRKIPQDFTFDQGRFKEHVKNWEVFYSVDLSSATDRFPIQVISDVLKGHLPEIYVNSWERVMVGLPFEYTAKTGKTTSISYSVGNPMGAYSSWASFAIAHHYLFFVLCYRLGIPWREAKYCVLGDDVIIGDKSLGDSYLMLIRELGVDYSTSKTHISNTTCEFAKRWIHKGEEITPFPLSALKNCGKKYYLLTALLAAEEMKGWRFDKGIGDMVGRYFGIFRSMPSKFRKDMDLKAFITEQVMKITWEVLPASDGVNAIIRRLGLTKIPILTNYSAMSVLINVVVTLFSDSNVQNNKKGGKPLGLLATCLVERLTEPSVPFMMTLLENPLLHAYGSIEQTYIDMIKKAREIDTVGKGEWPLILRSMAIPLSDSLFVDRQEATESMAISKIAKSVIKDLEMWNQYPQFFSLPDEDSK